MSHVIPDLIHQQKASYFSPSCFGKLFPERRGFYATEVLAGFEHFALDPTSSLICSQRSSFVDLCLSAHFAEAEVFLSL